MVNLPNSPFHPPAPPRPRPALSHVVTMRRDRAKMLTYRWDPHNPATILAQLHTQLAEEGPKQVQRVFGKHGGFFRHTGDDFCNTRVIFKRRG